MEAFQKIKPKQWKSATDFMKAIPDAVGSMEIGNEVLELFSDSLEQFLAEPLLALLEEVLNEENRETISNFARVVADLLIPAIVLATSAVETFGPALNEASEFILFFVNQLGTDVNKLVTSIGNVGAMIWGAWEDFWNGVNWEDFWENVWDDLLDAITKIF